MPDNSWSTFAEALLAVAAVIGVFGPIRWAIVAYLISTQLDFASIRGFEIPWLNATKGVGFPLLLVIRLKWLPVLPKRWPTPSKLWLLFVAYAGTAILWSPDTNAALKMLWYLIEMPLSFSIMCAAYEQKHITIGSLRAMVLGSLALAAIQTYIFGNVFGALPGDMARFTSFTSPQVFGQFLVYATAALMFSERQGIQDKLLIAAAVVAIALDGSRLAFAGLATVVGIRGWYYLKSARTIGQGVDRLLRLGMRACTLFLILAAWIVLAPDGRITGFARPDGIEYRGGTFGFRLEMYQATLNNLRGTDGGFSISRLLLGSGSSSGGQVATSRFTRNYAEYLDANRVIHNEFLRALYEWGIIGLVLMAGAMLAGLAGLWRAAKRNQLGAKAGVAIIPTILFSFLTENALGGACMCSWAMACVVLSMACGRDQASGIRYRLRIVRELRPAAAQEAWRDPKGNRAVC